MPRKIHANGRTVQVIRAFHVMASVAEKEKAVASAKMTDSKIKSVKGTTRQRRPAPRCDRNLGVPVPTLYR